MLDKLKAKGREVLVLFTAVAMLLSVALGVIGDALMLLVLGAIGWVISNDDASK
jgi:fucose permease